MNNQRLKKILLTGGSGLLGSYLRRAHPQIITPSHRELDITKPRLVEQYFRRCRPDIIIHGAAFVGPLNCDRDPIRAIAVNIVGTCNIALACARFEARLVYISTDYVFRGDRGHYREEDELLPQNMYAWSKLGGECAARLAEHSLIVRASFSPDPFPHTRAFVDQYTSRDALSVIAPLVFRVACDESITGVIHIGTKRKSSYALAKRLGRPKVGKLMRSEVPFTVPFDTSFNLNRLKAVLKQKN